MTRHLIATALEETWPSEDTPVVFLGEWCKLYNRKEKWSKYDSVTVSYHWDDRKKLYKDYLYLRDIYEEILQELSLKLNEIHGVDHSLRYWRILIGPWLGYFIQMVFDRYEMVHRACLQYSIGGVNCALPKIEDYVPNDMKSFGSIYAEDFWNQLIYDCIIQETNIKVNQHVKIVEKTGITEPKLSLNRKIRRKIASVLSSLSSIGVRDREAFLISSYLPTWEAIKFQIKLGQIPRFWRSIDIPQGRISKEKRQWKIPVGNKTGFEKFIRELIPFQIPIAYLEGYTSVQSLIEQLKWPPKPKFIFTSNNHNSDDIFKAWAGKKTEEGTPLIVGQHGGHYGVGLWSFMEEHEIAISDRYLTWGWKDEKQKKVKECFSLKLANQKDIVWDRKGRLYIVNMVLPQYSYWMLSAPVSSQINHYFRDQYNLIKGLDQEIRIKTTVRMYPNDWRWNQKDRWKDEFKDIKLDFGSDSMEKLYTQSRIFVGTYNATTFLETMCRNMPTIMFWNPEHWELRPSAEPFFEKLKSVGIFHESPESAANQVNKIWDDVPGWWNSKEVQSVKDEFCWQYARRVDNSVKTLKDIILS